MKLPTVKDNSTYFPKRALCPWCKKNKVLEPHSLAVLTGGALLMDRKRDYGGSDDRMNAYLSLRWRWHGAHADGQDGDRDIDEGIQIALDVRGGQFDLYFCSTKCLREYLNYCVDELDKKIKKKRRAM